MTETPDLSRFLKAQDAVWDTVISELAEGQKASHWMWFVFPQLKELGRSHRAAYYGIVDLGEAEAYVAHPVLGPRLAEASGLLLRHKGTPPELIMGSVDALKLRSSMTLFSRVAGADPVFTRLLDAFYAGEPCALTVEALARKAS